MTEVLSINSGLENILASFFRSLVHFRPTVKEEIEGSLEFYNKRLERHKNRVAVKLLDTRDYTFRLKWTRQA